MKKNKRIKLKAVHIPDRFTAEIAMTDLAVLVTQQRRIIADRDAAVLEINERCAPELARIHEQIQTITLGLQAWASATPEAFPKDRKSLQLPDGTIGFRTGNPTLKLLSRSFNWDKVVDLLKARWSHFIRVKREADKEAILAAYAAKKADDTQLAACGLKVTQDETFFADPDLSKLETRQTVEAK